MKNKAQTFCISVGIMFLVVFLALFMWVYQPQVDKTAALNGSNATLATRVAELEAFYLNMAQNQQEIELMTAEINENLKNFPSDVKEEDAVALALGAWDKGILVAYDSVETDEMEEMAVIPEETVVGANLENLSQALTFNTRNAILHNVTVYSEMKDLIQYINDSQDEMAINEVVYKASKNEETLGVLEGYVSVTFYTVAGTGKEYVPREFADYEIGKSNLFDMEMLQDAGGEASVAEMLGIVGIDAGDAGEAGAAE